MEFSHCFGETRPSIFSLLEQKRLELEAEGKELINLSIGTPDCPPDDFVMQAVSEAALKADNYKYSLSETKELTEAVQNWYKRRYHVSLAEDEIMSVYGSQEGLAHIAFPICDPGDIVLVPDPGYQIFSFGPSMAGVTLVPVPLHPEKGYILDFADIPEELARIAKMMVVSYPANPVTAVAPRAFYEELIQFAKKHDILIVHDNAYSELVFDGRNGGSILEIEGAKDCAVEFNSLSKSYNLTGCRISFLLGNREVIKRFRAFRSSIDYGTFFPVQYGAVAALNGPQDIVTRNCATYFDRSRVLTEGLSKIGWKVERSAGTMFVWAKLPSEYKDSTDFALKLMEKAGVITVPGVSFGDRGEGYVRFALTVPVPVIKTAIGRIADSGLMKKF